MKRRMKFKLVLFAFVIVGCETEHPTCEYQLKTNVSIEASGARFGRMWKLTEEDVDKKIRRSLEDNGFLKGNSIEIDVDLKLGYRYIGYTENLKCVATATVRDKYERFSPIYYKSKDNSMAVHVGYAQDLVEWCEDKVEDEINAFLAAMGKCVHTPIAEFDG